MTIRLCAAALAALAALAVPAAAEDLTFTLTNNSSSDVQEFYSSPTDVGDWEEDILGTDVLGSGQETAVTIADGRTQCEYDLRFVFTDGQVLEDGGINLCETGSYTLSDQ